MSREVEHREEIREIEKREKESERSEIVSNSLTD